MKNKGRRDSGPKAEMFDAVCDDCGKDCKVPFRPTGSKPIYCSRCFESHDSDRPQRRDSGSRSEMFSAVCDECGKDCEVPFKPSSDKPIYCSRCFEKVSPKKDGYSNSPRRDGYSPSFRRDIQTLRPDNTGADILRIKEQLKAMDEKIEKILSMMEKEG